MEARKTVSIAKPKKWWKTTSEELKNQQSTQGQLVLTFVNQYIC